ncbi:MAG: hypothetical protein ACOX4M_07810 [Acetivibrionales bacterium]|jgi:hypothetical protein
MGKAKNLLLITSIALVLIGIIYAMASQQVFGESVRIDAQLVEFVPEECTVTYASRGVYADIEFKCDNSGNIIDKTYLNLVARGVYEGSKASYRISMKNMSDFSLVVDEYRLEVDPDNRSLADLIYFSGSVKISRNNNEFYDSLGSFEMVGLEELDDKLTSIMEYIKIDAGETVVLEVSQQFDKDRNRFIGKSGLTYSLKPVFIQYFPSMDESRIALGDSDGKV